MDDGHARSRLVDIDAIRREMADDIDEEFGNVPLDRSSYNRAGVERVMGFCTPEEFCQSAPAFERMLARAHIPEDSWWRVEAGHENEARLICIGHLLGQVPCGEVEHPPVRLPERMRHDRCAGRPAPAEMFVPE